MNEEKKTIFVVAHKPFKFPKEKIYLPIAVGGKDIGNGRYVSDNTFDNISYLNDRFCELTAFYWAWKNHESKSEDIVGICHYRRYFFSKNKVIDEKCVDGFFEEFDIIVPKKRNYRIIKIKDHYGKAHDYNDLKILEEVISLKNPEYIESFNKVFESKSISLYNMMITRRYIFDDYCEWLFNIIFEMESIINVDNYDPYQRRLFGFLAERLLNVWLEKNKEKFKILYLDVKNTEGENILSKGIGLIKRQYLK